MGWLAKSKFLFLSLTMKLSSKISIVFLSIGILTAQVVFWPSYLSTEASIKQDTFRKLTAIREIKKRHIERYFTLIQKQTQTLAENHMVLLAAQAFSKAFRQGDSDQEESTHIRQSLEQFYHNKFHEGDLSDKEATKTLIPDNSTTTILQYQYIARNSYPIGEKDRLDSADDTSVYNQIHGMYHPVFRNYIQRYGFYDLFLVDTSGDIVYSVAKEIDYATNLTSGPFSTTNIAELFNRANMANSEQQTILVDFRPYLPSNNAPAAFVGAPLFWEKEKIGVVILQLSIDEINSVMTSGGKWRQDGLGESGETYLLGSDYTMRNDSRFFIETPHALRTEFSRHGVGSKMINYGTTILLQEVKTKASYAAMAGQKGTKIVYDYRNKPVLSSYSPVDIRDLDWVILSEIDAKEAFAHLNDLKNRATMSLFLISLCIVLLGLFMAKKITTPLHQLLLGIKKVEGGDLGQHIDIDTKDEFGNLADSFNQMRDSLQHTMISRDFFDNILTSMNESLFVIKCQTMKEFTVAIEMINPAAVKLLETSSKDLLNQDFSAYFQNNEIFTPDEWETLTREGLLEPIDKTLISQKGTKIPISLSAALLRDTSSTLNNDDKVIFVAQDIRTRKQYEEEIQRLADYDSLTGLPNRRVFNERLNRLTAHANRYGHTIVVFFIDLDRFKPVNDLLGHVAGDDLLKQVAERLLGLIRVSDTVARLGGDEFAVILPEIKTRDDAAVVATKILGTLNTPFTVIENTVEISGSIGIAIYPDHGSTWDAIVNHADTAMYCAKKSGGGAYCFYRNDMHHEDS